MGNSVEVDSNNFEREVLEQSFVNPVLVDFYATWCGPCQLLKPILEKLVQEYDFTLAKVDIDKDSQLARKYAVEGVPDVRIVSRGDIYPGFVGALNEEQLRDLLERLQLKSQLALKLEEAKIAIASGEMQTAKQAFDELFAQYPDNPRVIIEAARFLVKVGRIEEAEKIAKTIKEDNREFYPQAQGIQTLILLKRAVEETSASESELDLDRIFADASRLALSEDYQGALELFLQIVRENRKYKNDRARLAMIGLFNLLGLDHPLTKQYQKELMMALY
jgi:putative thioredoxin